MPNLGSPRPVGPVSSRWSLVEVPVCAEIARCLPAYLRFTPDYPGLHVQSYHGRAPVASAAVCPSVARVQPCILSVRLGCIKHFNSWFVPDCHEYPR